MAHEGIEKLVNRQVRAWEEERRARDLGTQGEPLPCITVSREFGTLGAKVAETVARTLGFAFYDQELITEIAQTENIRRAVLESVDERVRDRISEWIAEQFGGAGMTSSKFLSSLTRVLLTIGYHGKAVIVGRGAQFVLDPARTLRIRAYAPVEARVRHIMESRNLTREAARTLVDEMDNQRMSFYKMYFGKDWSLPEYYDLLINTAAYPPDAAARLVIEAFALRFGRPGQAHRA